MKTYILGAVLSVGIFISPALAEAQTVGDVAPQNAILSCVDIQNNLLYRSRDASTNGEVSLLQSFLQDRGLLSSDPTGFFGNMTLTAVKNFQSSVNILSSGYVGPVTRAKVKSISCGGTTTTTTTAATSLVPGCAPGAVFSATTGNDCGCPTGAKFSSMTGNACSGTTPTTYPPGCSSIIGFSSTTGQACGLTTTLTTANKPGTPTEDPSYIITTFTNLSPVNTLRFNLKFAEAGEGYLRIAVDDVTVRTIDQRFAPPGVTTQEEVYIGDGEGPLPPGKHKLVIRLDGFGANPSGVLLTDVVLGLTVTTTTATYPPGCTSYSGFSSTTGNACDGSTPTTTTSIPTGLTSTQINSLNSLLSSFGANGTTIANVNIVLNGGTVSTANLSSSNLTSAQVQSLLSLLSSFGANGTTIANVNAILSTGMVTATSPTTTTTTTTATYPSGCSSYSGYSSVNGNYCDPGCAPGVQFSSTTGNACAGA